MTNLLLLQLYLSFSLFCLIVFIYHTWKFMGRDVTIGELLAHTFVALFSVLNIAVLIECIGDIAGKSLCKIVILKGKKK